MPQVTIYLPKNIAEQVRKRARSLKKSLSAYLTGLARKDLYPAKWPKQFIKLYGSTRNELTEAQDLPLEERQEL